MPYKITIEHFQDEESLLKGIKTEEDKILDAMAILSDEKFKPIQEAIFKI